MADEQIETTQALTDKEIIQKVTAPTTEPDSDGENQGHEALSLISSSTALHYVAALRHFILASNPADSEKCFAGLNVLEDNIFKSKFTFSKQKSIKDYFS